jgi:AraC-like DNA-binding protein
VRLTGRVLSDQIVRAERGQAKLRVPKLEGLMRRVPGMPLHSHPELFIQLSGSCRFSFPSEVMRVAAGEICLVPRGMPHGERVSARSGPFYNLVFMFGRPTLWFHLAADDGEGNPTIQVSDSVPNPAVPRPSLYIDDVAELYQLRGPARDAAVGGLLLAHLSSLLLLLEGHTPPVRSESLKVAQTRELVGTKLSDPGLTVKSIARNLECSADYLSWLFHKETGFHLNAFINEQRLSQARYLLTESALNIKQVAAATGFADAGYFTRLFRRAAGQTPREFRRVVQHVGT